MTEGPKREVKGQLPMFVEAQALRSSITGTMDYSFDDPDDVMARKLVESKRKKGHGAGVHASVAEHGVLNPVQLVHGTGGRTIMGHGHHRVAAADEISRRTGQEKWVPVIHTDASEKTAYPVAPISEDTHKLKALQNYTEWSKTTDARTADVSWMVKSGMLPKRKRR